MNVKIYAIEKSEWKKIMNRGRKKPRRIADAQNQTEKLHYLLGLHIWICHFFVLFAFEIPLFSGWNVEQGWCERRTCGWNGVAKLNAIIMYIEISEVGGWLKID